MGSLPQIRPCPACSSEKRMQCPEYSPEPWQVVTCGNCNLTYLANPVAYEALEDDFAWEKTFVEKRSKGGSTAASQTIKSMRKKLGILHRARSERLIRWFGSGHVLDIGCGEGQRIVEPMVPYGIELSTQLHKIADDRMRARGGYCIHGAGAEAVWKFDEEQFDGILMHSYLEHETDVISVLKGAYRALKQSGKIFIRVPNFGSVNRKVVGPKWCGFRYPDHVNYFTRATLTQLAKTLGYETTLVNWTHLAFDDNIQVLLHKSKTPPAAAGH